MEVNKNMQQMPMDNMHNLFWRDDQVSVLFQSDQPLIIDGVLNQQPPQFFLEQYRDKLNGFLRDQGVLVTLKFLGESDNPPPVRSTPPLPAHSGVRFELADDFQPPPGIYPFGFTKPIESDSPF